MKSKGRRPAASLRRLLLDRNPVVLRVEREHRFRERFVADARQRESARATSVDEGEPVVIADLADETCHSERSEETVWLGGATIVATRPTPIPR